MCIQVFGLCVLAVYGPDIQAISYLTWLYLLSAIKVLITFLKFLPQVLFNYERKSTQVATFPHPVLPYFAFPTSSVVCHTATDWVVLRDWLVYF